MTPNPIPPNKSTDRSDAASDVGYACYGKLPGAGDFIARRMPYPLQQFWDRWLAEGVAALKARNPAPGVAVWGHAPKWAFLLPAQAGSPVAQLGVLAPSCDRVGRQFPFLVTAALPEVSAAQLLPRAAPITLAWAAAITDAQATRMTIDAVDGALGTALAAELHRPPPVADGEVTLPPGVSPLTLPWPELTATFDRQGAESYWWSVPPATTGFRARTHSGPLSVAQFVALYR